MSGIAQDSKERAQPMVLVVCCGPISQTEQMLNAAGFNATAITDGLLAFEQITSVVPDLFIIECDRDGIEMCRRLKGNMSTGEVPLLYVAAKDDHQSVQTA